VFDVGPPDVPYTPPPLRPIPNEDLFALEGRIIGELAEREDCVVVGRGAAHVLRGVPWATRVLLHAPVDFRVRRVMEVYHAPSEEQARTLIRESDRERRVLMERVGHTDWLHATHYHLAVDTSAMPIEDVADLIVAYARLRAGRGPGLGGLSLPRL
jgi:cytidylate kinase